MPLDFPDLQSVQVLAKGYKFRDIQDNETEADYRESLADHVTKFGFVEAQEIVTRSNGISFPMNKIKTCSIEY